MPRLLRKAHSETDRDEHELEPRSWRAAAKATGNLDPRRLPPPIFAAFARAIELYPTIA